MRNLKFVGVLLLLINCYARANAEVDNSAELKAAFSTMSKPGYKALTWVQLIQKKYTLSEDQTKLLTDSKMTDTYMAQTAQLAKSSGKSIVEILKMRNEKKMAWGKISKNLNVSAKDLGLAVSELRKEQSEERKKERTEKNRAAKEKSDIAKKDREVKRDVIKKEQAAKKLVHSQGKLNKTNADDKHSSR